MNKEFQKYNLEDFLEDPDFCNWIKTPNQNKDEYYQGLLSKFPDKKDVFYKAYFMIKSLEEEVNHTPDDIKKEKWNEVLSTVSKNKKDNKRRFLLKYAAIITVLVLIGSGMLYRFYFPNVKLLTTDFDYHEYSETTLFTSDGNEYTIAGVQSVVELTNDKVVVNGDVINNTSTKRDLNENFNKLIVPYGKQSKVILSDGTVVWLNAGSRLFYPSKFGKKERSVYIDGEAFFEVTKNEHLPFVLKMHYSEIKVLGTSFNVKSYSEEKEDEAILVEGSISLRPTKSYLHKDIILKPEERIVVDSDKSYTISSVDLEKMISWRKGILRLKEESLQIVINQISKFYGVNIKCNNEELFTDKKITGKLDLSRGCYKTLETLCFITGDIEFLRNNDEIILKSKNN